MHHTRPGRHVPAALLALACLVTAGCSSIHVDFDHDSDADFAAYHFYAWAPHEIDEAEAAQLNITPEDVAGIMHRVETALEAKGYAKNDDAPDFRVRLTLTEEGSVGISSHSRTADNQDGYSGNVIMSKDWILTMDILDAGSNLIVYRGWATDQAGFQGNSVERVELALDKILATFPPR